MPTAVAAERDELTHDRAVVIQSGNHTHRRQPPNPRISHRGRRPDKSRVKHEIHCVDDLGHHGRGARRMWTSKSETSQTRQSFPRTFRMNGAHRSGMPGVHRVEKVESLAPTHLADDDAV